MHPISPRAYSIPHAATLLDLSESALRRRIEAGVIKVADFGIGKRRILRVLSSEIDRLLGVPEAKRACDHKKAAREWAECEARLMAGRKR